MCFPYSKFYLIFEVDEIKTVIIKKKHRSRIGMMR
jgi:hypothetical protein